MTKLPAPRGTTAPSVQKNSPQNVGELRRVVDAKFAVDVVAVSLDRTLGKTEPRGHLPVRKTFRQKREHFPLARTHFGVDGLRRVGREKTFAFGQTHAHGPLDGLFENLPVDGFFQKVEGPRLHGLHGRRDVPVARDEDDRKRSRHPAQTLLQLQAQLTLRQKSQNMNLMQLWLPR